MQIRKIKNIAKCSKTMELQSIVHSFLSIILVAKCCAAGNVSTESNLQARLGFHPVEFKCHYTLGPHETVHARNISWQIESVTGSGQFETIAEFSLPNAPRQSNQYVTTSVGTDFKTRSALLNVVSSGSNSYTAVFRLIEVRCEDEGNFRCSVVFSSTSGSTTISSDVSLFLTAPAEKPYRAPGPIPDDLEEGMSVKFSCTANVGKPPGNIKWWRYQQGRSVPNFMGQSDTVPLMKTDVCAYNVTSYISAFTMSRNDDKSVWRCSVNNNLLTAYPDYDKPYEETKGIRVYYKVETPSIEVIPKGPRYEVGASLTIYCTADGNPSPLIDNHINYYLWIFRARGTAKDIVLTSNNGLLALQNLQVENSGKYTCTAHNSYNGKEFSSSNHIEVIIQIGPSGNLTTESTTAKGTSQGSGNTAETTTGLTSASPIVSSGGPTPGSNGNCRDNPSIDCRMYNFNVTCKVDGMYYPWAKVNCPLYCGYCQAPTVSVECKDKLTNCDEYQDDLCSNHMFLVFRETNCRKFCNICTGGVDFIHQSFG